jgi:hypothetical protein
VPPDEITAGWWYQHTYSGAPVRWAR